MHRLAPCTDSLHAPTCSMHRLAPCTTSLHAPTCIMHRLVPCMPIYQELLIPGQCTALRPVFSWILSALLQQILHLTLKSIGWHRQCTGIRPNHTAAMAGGWMHFINQIQRSKFLEVIHWSPQMCSSCSSRKHHGAEGLRHDDSQGDGIRG